jgi:hypothetical protein
MNEDGIIENANPLEIFSCFMSFVTFVVNTFSALLALRLLKHWA